MPQPSFKAGECPDKSDCEDQLCLAVTAWSEHPSRWESSSVQWDILCLGASREIACR